MDIKALVQVIGPNIRRYREKAGLTQSELAERVGVTTPSISKMECGTKAMKLITLYNIADALNVGMDALVYEAHNRFPAHNIQRMLDGKSLEFVETVEDVIRALDEHFGKEDDKK